MLMSRAQVSAIVALVLVTWAAWLAFAGATVGIDHFKPFSLAVTVLFGAATAFNLWLWRLPLIRAVLSDRPVLRGTWKIEITSNFIDQVTRSPKVVEAYYLVRQTYSHISIRLFTQETTSKTQAAQLIKSDDGEWTLQGTYLDTPSVAVRDKSVVHFGALQLLLAQNPVTSFQGHYWTDRETRGNVRSLAFRPELSFGDFASAKKAFE